VAGLVFATILLALLVIPTLGDVPLFGPAAEPVSGARASGAGRTPVPVTGAGGAPTAVAPVIGTDRPREAVLASVAALHGERAWHARQLVSVDNDSYVQTITFTAPDRYRIYQPNIMEVILIGDAAYLKDEATWREDPTAAAAARAVVNGLLQSGHLDEALGSQATFVGLGPRQVQGEMVDGYRYTFDRRLADVELPVSVTVWVRARDGLPLEQEIRDTFAGRETVTEIRFDYDPDLVIEAPPLPTGPPTVTPFASPIAGATRPPATP